MTDNYQFLHCYRCRAEVSDYDLEAVKISCGCERRFCKRCMARTEREGNYESISEWCEGLADMHRRGGGRYINGHNGPLIRLDFGRTQQEFFLYSFEVRRNCVTGQLKTFVRPWLAHEMAMLIGCPYSNRSEMDRECQRRRFRQRARDGLQLGAA